MSENQLTALRKGNGMALASASVLLILTYVTVEFSYDKMHAKYPRCFSQDIILP